MSLSELLFAMEEELDEMNKALDDWYKDTALWPSTNNTNCATMSKSSSNEQEDPTCDKVKKSEQH
jgi:hypothetical protein